MFKLPKDRKVRVPLAVGMVVIAVGFFFFESLGAFIGHYSEDIQNWESRQIEAHPGSVQEDGYTVTTVDSAAATGLGRIQFFHGHGYLMVLASLAFLLLIAFAPGLRPKFKGVCMWVCFTAMFFYNVGWGVAGIMVPFMGVDGSLQFAERLFFIPFGLTIVTITGIIAVDYGIHAVRVIRGKEKPDL